jgi:ankyrin repeat protein
LTASEEDRFVVVKLLLEKGVNMRALDKDDDTPIQFARDNGQVDAVALLGIAFVNRYTSIYKEE